MHPPANTTVFPDQVASWVHERVARLELGDHEPAAIRVRLNPCPFPADASDDDRTLRVPWKGSAVDVADALHDLVLEWLVGAELGPSVQVRVACLNGAGERIAGISPSLTLKADPPPSPPPPPPQESDEDPAAPSDPEPSAMPAPQRTIPGVAHTHDDTGRPVIDVEPGAPPFLEAPLQPGGELSREELAALQRMAQQAAGDPGGSGGGVDANLLFLHTMNSQRMVGLGMGMARQAHNGLMAANETIRRMSEASRKRGDDLLELVLELFDQLKDAQVTADTAELMASAKLEIARIQQEGGEGGDPDRVEQLRTVLQEVRDTLAMHSIAAKDKARKGKDKGKVGDQADTGGDQAAEPDAEEPTAEEQEAEEARELRDAVVRVLEGRLGPDVFAMALLDKVADDAQKRRIQAVARAILKYSGAAEST